MVILCPLKDAGIMLPLIILSCISLFIFELFRSNKFSSTKISSLLTLIVSCIRYAKVNELLTNCSIGTKIILPQNEDDNPRESIQYSFPFLGQIGPLYVFGDAISSEQVKAIYSLGPSYMYSFLDNEASAFGDSALASGILDAKDGLASKIVFGLNAQVLFLPSQRHMSTHSHACLKGNSTFVSS